VGADRRPGEDDPPDRVHVEGQLAEVGRVRVTGTESKGKGNKRIRIAVEEASVTYA
jgi:Ser-tRNA(Ala) deacylase AlaX